MNTRKKIYEEPIVELVKIQVEKGFAVSNPLSTDQLPDLLPGGNWN